MAASAGLSASVPARAASGSRTRSIRVGVEAAVKDLWGSGLGIKTFRRMPGGASRELWFVEVPGAPIPRLVLRRDPPGSIPKGSRLTEFLLLRAAATAGVPVPGPLSYEPAGGRFGTEGFLMTFVEGESLPKRILNRSEFGRAREVLPHQLATALARIHALEVGTELGRLDGSRTNPVSERLEHWEAELSSTGEPFPVLELGLRWLRHHAPAAGAPSTLLHGDFRMGNCLVGAEGLTAVLDWENAHLGTPAEDVGWLCARSWRFGAAARVGGLCPLEDFLAAYLAAGGHASVTADAVLYWEIFANVKWAVICAQQAQRHLSGDIPSLERAVLGRRACEPEWDLLSLIRRAG